MSTSLMHHNYIMCPISSSQKENILSLASNGHSTCHIASSLGVSQPTVSRVLKDLLPNRDIPLSGHPSKLSPTSQHSMSHKSPWERLPMLSNHPTHQFHHLHPSLLTDSQKSPQETLMQGCDRRKSHCSLQFTKRSSWPLRQS